ncbi:NUMOD4 domain-containing protein [Paraburkholderia sp. BL17N1]|uniref:NUMOD4 domain-containing protein n=1 Tax=Paraburkholderia sp. BL17N1 TaxID=1938798 RepID=UPI000EB25B1F|nr:NUMOD4 domain-containing protein [Paraburkholderia sp. BL17N1]RKR45938.1 HNH endonuclease [Paraburkholderia sp. BL17N1]
MTEYWRDIPDYKGLYQASDLGRIRSLDRIRLDRGQVRGKVLKLVPANDGYLVVELSRDGQGKRRYVHQLVMEAFVGPCPEAMQVCHTHDPDPTNNRLGNLRYDTPKGNTADKYVHGTLTQPVKKTIFVAAVPTMARTGRLTKEQMEEIRKRRAAGEAGMSLAREFGVSQPRIRQIVLHR